MDQQLLDLARGLRSLVEDEADTTDELCTMAPAVVDAIDDAGLFRLMVPASLGGLEADVETVVAVCEELSFADGSTGWAFAQNITTAAYVAYMDPVDAKPFASARACAGMFAPMGVATEVDGGYLVSGSYRFGSGSGHAEALGGSATVMVDGQMAPMFEGGVLPVIGFLVPADRAELRREWDVMGLRGTGSFDFDVPEQFVPAGATWPVLTPGRSPHASGGPIYGLGPIPIGTVGSCAWAVGVARRALHEITEIALAGRERMGSPPMREQQVFQRDLGVHTTAVEAAHVLAVHTYTTAVDAIAEEAPDPEVERLIRETKAAATHVVRVSRDAATWAWQTSGSHGIRNPSVLQRCHRDLSVGAGHMVFDDRNFVELAKTRLGIEPSPF